MVTCMLYMWLLRDTSAVACTFRVFSIRLPMCAGALQLLAIRPVMQAYFNGGKVAYLRAKNAACKSSEKPQVAQYAGALVGNINALFPSVLGQISAPAVCLLVWGALLWHAAMWRRPAPTVSPEEALFNHALTDFINPHRGLIRVAASACGFAALLAHSLFAVGGLALCRLGAMGA